VANYVEALGNHSGLAPGDRLLSSHRLASIRPRKRFSRALVAEAPPWLSGQGPCLDSIPGFLRKCREWHLTVLDLPTAYWHELTAGLRA
jgi:hypothetical protein